MRPRKETLSHERLLEVLNYDASNGAFASRKRRARAVAGKRVGTVNRYGYRTIIIDYAGYDALRLAHFYMHGTFPNGKALPIDGNPDNTRIANIRVVAQHSLTERPAPESLWSQFHYDASNGLLVSKMRCKGHTPGPIACKRVRIGGIPVEVSHLAYAMHHKEWPSGNLFFKNGKSSDLSIANIGIVPVPPKNGVITAEYVRSVLFYEGGRFFHAVTQGPATFGFEAGHTGKDGRRYVRVNNKTYFASRLAILYTTGKWPEHYVDHISRDPTDDRRCNLREVNFSQSASNRRCSVKTKSGVKGVYLTKEGTFFAHCNGWVSKRFKTLEEAIVARIRAEIDLQGSYAFTPRAAKRDAYENMANQLRNIVRPGKTNTGLMGIYKHRNDKFKVRRNGRHVGTYATFEEAKAAYLAEHREDANIGERSRLGVHALTFPEAAQMSHTVATYAASS